MQVDNETATFVLLYVRSEITQERKFLRILMAHCLDEHVFLAEYLNWVLTH